MRRLVIATALPFVLVGTASPCLACSCAVSEPAEHAATASSVFTGRVADIRTVEEPFPGEEAQSAERRPIFVVRFDVETAYKGDVPAAAEVRTERDSAACGIAFEPGKRYTVFTFDQEGAAWTGLCSGTVPGPIEAERYGLTEQQIGEPSTTGPGTSPVSDRSDPSRPWGWLAAFLVAAGAVLVVPRLTRRPR